MNNNKNILTKWIELFEDHKSFKKNLIRLEKIDLNESSFFSDLRIIDNTIFGKYDVGYNSINFVTVKKIIDFFWEINEFTSNDYFLICTDGSPETKEIIENILNYNHNKIKFLFFSNYEGFDKKFISSNIKKLKPKSSIHLFKSLFDKKIININLYGKEGIKVNNSILETLINKLDKNLDNIVKQEQKISSYYLNNEELIKIFVDKMSGLFPKTNISRKTKIVISNRSNGITKIFAKLLGSQDFSYVVNNKIRKKDINLLNLPHTNDFKIKKYFWKEIFFAKKKKANILLIFNREGTQFFIFVLHGTRVYYINENLISLIFLHNFYNSMALNNKIVPNLFIASNENPNTNILNIINKYKIDFRKIKDNNFISKDYMLLYWNDYNQVAFGETNNDEFTIYHLLIKTISIMDYYINQYNSIVALLNNMNKMYGDFIIEEKFVLKYSKEEVNEKIKKFLDVDKNKKDFQQIKYIENQSNHTIENDMWELKTESDQIIRIKYNEIINKIFITILSNKNFNLIKKWQENLFEKKQLIKKLLK